jgi:hypothetical protein
MLRPLTVLLLLSLLVMPSSAQDSFTSQDVIAIVAAHPAFATGLDNSGDWSARAYNTRNRYGIWRVEFKNAAGDDLGWATVDPAKERLYSYEAYFGATDAQRLAAEPILREFISTQPELLALLEDPSIYDMYVDYDGYNDWWGVYIDIGADSLYVVIRFADHNPDSLENPQLVTIYFENVLSYDEWYTASSQAAIAIAFQQSEIAAALRGSDDWTTTTSTEDSRTWQVVFLLNDTPAAEAIVNLEDKTVVEFSLAD